MKQPYKIGKITIGEGMPKICAPLTGAKQQELIEECALIRETEADLAEWRVDYFESAHQLETVLVTLEKVKAALPDMPLIFSFRTAKEGGEKEISNEYYVTLNKAAAASGYVDIIDIELFRGQQTVRELVKAAKENQVYTVISNHDFEQTPPVEELINRVEEAMKLGGNIPKLAVMPEKEEDILTVLEASLHVKRLYPQTPKIMIAMGGTGVISRISGEIFGSVITFASAKNTSAPGQISVKDMKATLRLIHNVT